MLEPMRPPDFAEFTRCPLDEIERYRAAGILDPEKDGLLDDADVLRLMIVRSAANRGRSVEEILDEYSASEHPVARRLFRTSRREYTIEEAADRAGIDVERVRALHTALGMTPGAPLAEEDLRGITGPDGLSLMPWDALIEGARIYGDGLRRLADAGSHLTHRYLCEPLMKAGMSEAEVVVQLGEVFESVTASVTEFVYHMWSDYLLRTSIDHAVLHLLPKDPAAPPGTVATTIVFADLALSTSIAELEGDEAAFGVIDRTDRAVRALGLSHGGRLVKQIGDEFMLTFPAPAAAVRFAVDLGEHISRTEERHVAARIGIHSGRVLYRLGDYYGQAVNVAARIASMAMPTAILVTEPVAKAAANDGVAVEEIGVRSLRGMEEPIPIYRVLTSEREG